MPFLKDRSKAAPSRVGSDPFIDSSGSPSKSSKSSPIRGGSPTSPRVLKNASPTSKQQPANGIGRSPPTPSSPTTSTSSSGRNSISPTRRKGAGSIGASRQNALPPLHLNLSNIKKIVAWPGQPVNPPTPLAHPPTPLARPPLPGTPSIASANGGSSSSFPFGNTPGNVNAAASSSRQGKQAAVNPSVAALRMSRNEGTRDMLSPFALPSHQPQQYIAYNLDASTPKSPVAPLSPPATPHSSKTILSGAQTSPQRITAPLPKSARPYKVPAIPPFKQQQAEAKTVIKESKGGPPPSISASNTFIKEKGLAPAFVAQYDILNELGSGGFGFVVRARRKRDGFIVAVKFIFRERIPSHSWVKARAWTKLPNGQPDNVDRLVPMEAYVLRMIRHRGVVAFLDLLEDANVFYLVMEHHGTPWMASNENDTEAQNECKLPPSPASTEGGLPELALHNTPSEYFSSSSTLSSSPSSSTGPPTPVSPNMPLSTPAKLAPPPMLRRSSCDLFECIEQHSRLSEDQARFVFAQIVDVVYHLATMGICHRDIKDENIVVDQDFRVKLIDFGSAVIYDVRKPVPYHSRFFGTVNFAASEILQGRPYRAPHAEVWSLGVLLSILLNGETPFPDPDHAVKGIISKPKAAMSAEALDLMLGCLEVDPEHRLDIYQIKTHPWLLYPRSS